MTNYIEQLRAYCGFEGGDDREEVQRIDDLLYEAEAYDVQTDFREGGRWSNYETTVYKVEENGVTAYFEVDKEVPATEMQEGGSHAYAFREVKPVEKTIIAYEGV